MKNDFETAVERMLSRETDSRRIDPQLRYLRNEVARWHDEDRELDTMRDDNLQERLTLTDRQRHQMLTGKVDESLDHTGPKLFLWDYKRHRHIKVRAVRDWLMYFIAAREKELGWNVSEPLKPWVTGTPMDEQPAPPAEAQHALEEAKRK